MKQTCVVPGGKPSQAKFDLETKRILESYEKEFGCDESENKPKTSMPPVFVRGGIQGGISGSEKVVTEDKEKGTIYTPISSVESLKI